MAGFSVHGLDEFALSLQEIADIPEAVQDEMLQAQADVVVAAQKKKIRAYGIYDEQSTKHVADSIKKGRIKTKKGARVINVSPSGSRRRGKKVTRNAEVLFVNEFGKRGQKARPAVRDANAESAEETTRAGLQVLDKFFKSKDL